MKTEMFSVYQRISKEAESVSDVFRIIKMKY